MGKSRLFAVLACAVAVLGVGASGAFAGEITGNGKPTHAIGNASSACAFSGQEDDQFASGGSKGVPAHSQSYGQLLKAERNGGPPPFGFPGDNCRGNLP
jgi:hypothetical protein